MITREVRAKSILSRSGIGGITYCINPYTGCAHGCSYCYASFMKRFTGHREPWGSFVDVKANAPELLKKQIARAAPGTVLLSSVTDPYQPAEARFRITRGCLEVLAHKGLPLDILTKSPLVLRDLDLLETFEQIEVGLTVTTNREAMRKLFEPQAPPVKARIDALKTLHSRGIETYAFIGPILPQDPEALAESLRPHVDRVLIDAMNYRAKTVSIYKRERLDEWLDMSFVDGVMARLKKAFGRKEVICC